MENELQDLLIRLAANITEEDLLADPQLEESIREIVGNLNDSQDLDDNTIAELSQIKDKGQRFLAAMQMLQVKPDHKTMTKLTEAMQRAGLLNDGQVEDPENPQQELEPEHQEKSEDDFLHQMKQEGQDHEDVDISEQEAMEADSRERDSKE